MDGEEELMEIAGHAEAKQRIIIGRVRAMLAEEADASGEQQCRGGCGRTRAADAKGEVEDEQQRAEGRQRRGQAKRPFAGTEQVDACQHRPYRERRLGVPQVGDEAVGRHEAEAAGIHLERVHHQPRFVPEHDPRGRRVDEEKGRTNRDHDDHHRAWRKPAMRHARPLPRKAVFHHHRRPYRRQVNAD